MRRLLPLLASVLLLVLLWLGLAQNPREIPSPLIGRPVPEFFLPALEGDAVLSHGDLHGEVSLVNVWASWCVSCRAEHPHLLALQQQGVRLVGLNYRDERVDALAYLEEFGNPYHLIGWDGDGRVGIEWGVYATPESFLIDKSGTVRYKHIGPLNQALLEQTLLPMIRALQEEG